MKAPRAPRLSAAARAACAAAALALAASGCATVTYSEAGGRTMVDISNSGWYLLNFIPLASGDPDKPNAGTCRLFRQTTTLENNIRMLDRAVEERKASGVKSVTSHWTDENVMIILFKRHCMHTSAELLP